MTIIPYVDVSLVCINDISLLTIILYVEVSGTDAHANKDGQRAHFFPPTQIVIGISQSCFV